MFNNRLLEGSYLSYLLDLLGPLDAIFVFFDCTEEKVDLGDGDLRK